MPIPGNGPIQFTDIQEEFGGTSPIAMDEYVRGYDKSDYVFFDATSSGSTIIINGNSDWQNTVWRVPRKKIMLRTQSGWSAGTTAFSSSDHTSGNSDVINDGAIGTPVGSYDSMGLDLTNSYFDDKMSADGTTVSFYVKSISNQQMSWRFCIVEPPSGGYQVNSGQPQSRITISPNIIGGSETVLTNSGAYSAIASQQEFGSLLLNGQSMSFKLTASALPNLYQYGSYVYFYVPIWTATPNSSLTGYSYSSPIGAYWRGTSYVGGSGAYANNATGVAQYLDTISGTSTNFGSTMSLSTSRSGSVVTFTLTNNGPSRLIGRYDLAGTGRHSCCNIGYTDANSASTLISSSTTWGDPHVRQYYGSKLWGKIDFSITAGGNTENTYLNFGPCANGANQSSVMQTIIDATTKWGDTIRDPNPGTTSVKEFPFMKCEQDGNDLVFTNNMYSYGKMSATLSWYDTNVAKTTTSETADSGGSNTAMIARTRGIDSVDKSNINIPLVKKNIQLFNFKNARKSPAEGFSVKQEFSGGGGNRFDFGEITGVALDTSNKIFGQPSLKFDGTQDPNSTNGVAMYENTATPGTPPSASYTVEAWIQTDGSSSFTPFEFGYETNSLFTGWHYNLNTNGHTLMAFDNTTVSGNTSVSLASSYTRPDINSMTLMQGRDSGTMGGLNDHEFWWQTFLGRIFIKNSDIVAPIPGSTTMYYENGYSLWFSKQDKTPFFALKPVAGSNLQAHQFFIRESDGSIATQPGDVEFYEPVWDMVAYPPSLVEDIKNAADYSAKTTLVNNHFATLPYTETDPGHPDALLYLTKNGPITTHSGPEPNKWHYVWFEVDNNGTGSGYNRIVFQGIDGVVRTMTLPSGYEQNTPPQWISLGGLKGPKGFTLNDYDTVGGNVGPIRISNGKRFSGVAQTAPTSDFVLDGFTIKIIRPQEKP